MAFNVNNFVIDHVIRFIMLSTNDNSVLWSINQVTDPALSCASETTSATDALQTPIMTFERAKTATFSGSNAIFDLNLLAAQMGTEKEIASAENTIIVPCFETITIESGKTQYTLKHTPTEEITFIYALNGDETLGTAYTAGTAASATEFVYASGGKITVPTGAKAGDQFFVIYDYESAAAVSVTNSAKNFPKAGKGIMEILGADVCDPTNLIYAYLILPNAKLSSSVDITLATEGGMPFSIECAQGYCDKEKKLFQLVVPDPNE